MIKFDVDVDVEVLYGWCETEERMVANPKRFGFGFEARKICRDRNGVITEITDWSPPLVWYFFESKPKPTLFERIRKWFKS